MEKLIAEPYPSSDYIAFVEAEARGNVQMQHESHSKLKAEAHRLIQMQVLLASAGIGYAASSVGAGETTTAIVLVFFAGLAFAVAAAVTAMMALKHRDLPATHNEPGILLRLHHWGVTSECPDEATREHLQMSQLAAKQRDISELCRINERLGTLLNRARAATACVPLLTGVVAMVLLLLGKL